MLPGPQSLQRLGYLQRAGVQSFDDVAEVQPYRGQHLVVARAAEMHAPAGCADARRETLFESCLAVLVRQLDVPFAALVLGRDCREPRANRIQIRLREQFLCVEHLRMRYRCPHVVTDQALIQRVVLAGRVLKHTVVQRRTLVPEASHVRRMSARFVARPA